MRGGFGDAPSSAPLMPTTGRASSLWSHRGSRSTPPRPCSSWAESSRRRRRVRFLQRASLMGAAGAASAPLAMGAPFYITTAINYPNGPPHIGHAYEAVAADVIARFQRARGRDVRFQTGTDEHGLKMAQAARSEGQEPREYALKMSAIFQQMCDVLNVSYDRFIRTSEPDHHRASQAIWTAMEERGDLY